MSRFEAEVFLSLAPGDAVVGEDESGLRWQGTVDMTGPEHGVIWVFTDLGERKLLDISEHSVQRVLDPVEASALTASTHPSSVNKPA